MEIAAAVISGFVVGAVAPGIYRIARGVASWILAVLPLGLFAYFATYLGRLPAAGIVFDWPWAPSMGLRLSFLLDGLSLLFALLISGIGTIILIYAGGYLSGDDRLGRLYALLLMFMASMLGVVLADNVLTLFVFWELTSFTSYMLIGYDHERPAARAAALQALLVTGGGGLALLAGLLMLGQVAVGAGVATERSLELSSLIGLGEAARGHALYLPIVILILTGAFTKSAQVPFHFWLPSAMEAPTPVSAYLHSATMVKAGVYLVARLQPVLGDTELWLWALGAFGGTTMVVGALLALQERDMKRILAYSTVSALGLLVLLIGVGSEKAAAAAMTFLLAHALYKAALFLVAGAVDHATHMRNVDRLSGLGRTMPVTAFAASVAALSMAGLPPLFGFVAKEMFYEVTLHSPPVLLLTSAGVLASMLFVAVAIMVGVRPFFGTPSEEAAHAQEGPPSVWLGPLLMVTLSLMFGILPALVDQSLLAAASRAVSRSEALEPLRLALWHGWNEALLLSGLTLLGGIALFVARSRFHLRRPLLQWGPARCYELGLRGLNAIARLQTEVLQSGYLRRYILIILVSAIGMAGYTLLFRSDVSPFFDLIDVRFHEAALVALVVLSTMAAIRAKSRLSAIAALGGVGFGIALIFVMYGAPDLAMTQFAVETLTVILFVLVFYHLSPSIDLSSAPTRLRDAVVAIAIGMLMTTLVLMSVEYDFFPKISSYYSAHSVAEAHGRNIVNVILVDYRGIDTLGEITVLAAAGIGVYSILKLRPREGRKP